MDVLKVIARNAYYKALAPFKQDYDNYRDDHDDCRDELQGLQLSLADALPLKQHDLRCTTHSSVPSWQPIQLHVRT